MAGDDIGDRMKHQYEDRTRYFLPRRTYTIVRVDGKAFHGYTRHCERPFDYALMADMDAVAVRLCEQMQGSEFAYVQSDEISVLLTDFAKITTDAWFDGNIQKMVSIAGSMATAALNARRADAQHPAMFDARAFTIPDPVEVENYFIWRQQDATRNSIQMAAHARFSHREMHGQNTSALQEMLFGCGVNWNDYPDGAKRGRCVIAGEERGWKIEAPPMFTQDRKYLRERIPLIGAEPSTVGQAPSDAADRSPQDASGT